MRGRTRPQRARHGLIGKDGVRLPPKAGKAQGLKAHTHTARSPGETLTVPHKDRQARPPPPLLFFREGCRKHIHRTKSSLLTDEPPTCRCPAPMHKAMRRDTCATHHIAITTVLTLNIGITQTSGKGCRESQRYRSYVMTAAAMVTNPITTALFLSRPRCHNIECLPKVYQAPLAPSK